mmetsp:Transcript_17738/g.39924  ORF Transcript_17738/g.39924 Transcript_17738/m.39924 type:complete len:241 (-) Transcript_17738:70-792(-)
MASCGSAPAIPMAAQRSQPVGQGPSFLQARTQKRRLCRPQKSQWQSVSKAESRLICPSSPTSCEQPFTSLTATAQLKRETCHQRMTLVTARMFWMLSTPPCESWSCSSGWKSSTTASTRCFCGWWVSRRGSRDRVSTTSKIPGNSSGRMLSPAKLSNKPPVRLSARISHRGTLRLPPPAAKNSSACTCSPFSSSSTNSGSKTLLYTGRPSHLERVSWYSPWASGRQLRDSRRRCAGAARQ